MNKLTTPRIKPHEILDEHEISNLREKSDIRGISMLAHAWFVILASLIIFTIFPNVITFLLAVLVIAGRQLGLAILMHEGAHGLIVNNTKHNNLLSQWICAFPVWSDTYGYRHYHLAHHRHTQTADDPDISLSKPFPVNKLSFVRKVLRDIFGITGLVQRYELIFKTILTNDIKKDDGKKISGFQSKNTLFGILISNIIIFIFFSAIGQWWYYFAFWLLPLLTFFQLFLRIRNIAEHAGVKENCNDFNNARTTYANILERVFVAPYYVNYHLEHHLLMFVPCYKLKEAHKLLLKKGHKQEIEIKDGYISLLRSVIV
jgi:fatty acid desaturase